VPLLVDLGREARLLEVLGTIHRLVPKDQEVIGRLARLKVARREFSAGLGYYNKLEQTGYVGSDLYAGRAALYEELGQPSLALADHKKLLALSPGAKEVLRRSLFLAGELGDVSFLVQTGAWLESMAPMGEQASEVLLLAEAFARARDLSRALHYYRLVLSGFERRGEGGAVSELSRQARLGLARIYRREGLPFEAEQVLREGLFSENDQGSFLLGLFELSLAGDPPDLESARVWLKQYLSLPGVEPVEAPILQARLLAASGETERAEKVLRNLLAELRNADGRQSASEIAMVTRQAGFVLAEILLETVKLPEAEQQCLLIAGAEADPEVLVLLQSIYRRAGENAAAAAVLQGLMQSESDGIKLLELAELLQKRGLSEEEAAVGGKVLSDWPISLRAGLVKAEALIKTGRNVEALQLGATLVENFPGSLSVMAIMARIHYHAGQFQEAISLCKLILAREPGRFDIRFLLVWCEMARGNQVEATRLVQELYPVAGSQLLFKRLIDAGLPVPPPHKRSWWQVLTFKRPPFDLVGETLKAGFLFDQSLPEKRKVNELVTSMSVWLRWEKSFRAALVGG
ncbi:MAG TPA: tetratricopeptide repeat protein, partial [Desulfurivibrionaceae bacterium]|nr:tetratricopeptide repeat protein [Desulfurivibrionaceae bacterium]